MGPVRRLALILMAAASTLAADVKELEAVTWEMERRGLIAPDFGGWQKRHRPEFDWASTHFDLLHSRLDRVTAGEVDRLIVQIAIRHGKTETLTGYMAYRLALDPSLSILLGTYAERQAHKMSRAVRKLAIERGVKLSAEKDTAGEWETTEGGGVLAVGAGTGVASVNAGLIVLDDPIGKRAGAESAVHRDRVWDWITTDILARAVPETRVVFSMPRWHVDDPSGRLQTQQSGRWDLIDLPCIAEANDQLGRKEGELLWPSHRPESWVEDRKVELGSYGFASAVQCRPRPRDGGMFRWAWIQDAWVDAWPVDVVSRVRYWDTAGTERGGDYTAGVRMSLGRDGLYYIEDVVRGQWSPGQRDGKIQEACREDSRMMGHYEVGVEAESGIGGKDRTKAIVAQLAGLSVYSERPTGSKENRADPLASQMEVGNVRLVRGDWNTAFVDELMDFPSGAHDDQVDAASGAFARLALRSGRMQKLETVRF